MTPRHRRICTRISVAIVLLSSLGLAAHASYRAEQADMRAEIAWTSAEIVAMRIDRPRRVVVDWAGLEERIERAERDASEARACSDWLLLVVRAVVTAWPQRPNLPSGPEWCVLGGVDGGVTIGIGKVGERREWKGRVLRAP